MWNDGARMKAREPNILVARPRGRSQWYCEEETSSSEIVLRGLGWRKQDTGLLCEQIKPSQSEMVWSARNSSKPCVRFLQFTVHQHSLLMHMCISIRCWCTVNCTIRTQGLELLRAHQTISDWDGLICSQSGAVSCLLRFKPRRRISMLEAPSSQHRCERPRGLGTNILGSRALLFAPSFRIN